MIQRPEFCFKATVLLALFTSLAACAPHGGGFQQQEPAEEATPSPTLAKAQISEARQSRRLSPPTATAQPAPEKEATEKLAEKPKENSAQDILPGGFAKPTIYYFPVINEDENGCNSKRSLTTKNGASLASICEKTFDACALQGSCAVVQNNHLRSFNIVGRYAGVDRFFETTNADCKFGLGVKNSCLDPFYTIAADLNFHKPGDVIYVPALRGLELPNGSKHDGYVIVRDTGRAIKGEGRFDFFSGYFSWRDQNNPFNKIGLSDKKTPILYYKIKGQTAQTIRTHRQFPGLPAYTVNVLP